MGKRVAEQLTKKKVDALLPDTVLRRYPDAGVQGLFVQVTPKGTKTFVLFFRVNGRGRWLTLGRYGALTLDQARKQAQLQLGEVAKGSDPAADRTRKRLRATVAVAVEDFLEEHVKVHLKPKTRSDYESSLRRHILPSLGNEPIEALDRPTVIRWHQSLRKTPRAANLSLSILSKLISYAEATGMREPSLGNPARKVPRFPEQHRERTLDDSELKALFRAMDVLAAKGRAPRGAVDLFRLLLFTGARRDELRLLRWNEVDLEKGLLRLKETKGRRLGDMRTTTVALSPPAVELLSSQPRLLGNPYVFPGTQPREPWSGLHRIWARLLKEAGLTNLHIHDLRHTFGTFAGALGLSGPQIQAALNHASPAMTSRYVNLRSEAQQQVADAVAVVMQSIAKAQ